MQLRDFKIGIEFICSEKRWRCTDIGTRVIVAICLDEYNDQSWFNGPPYAVSETVFDESDIKVCHPIDNKVAS